MVPQLILKTAVIILVLAVSILPTAVDAQQPYPGQMPGPAVQPGAPVTPGRQQIPGQQQMPMQQQIPMQPQMPMQQQMPGQQGMPSTYAFRPDLTNPEYGHCLNLEKHWKNLWQMYAHHYNMFRSMYPRDPRAVKLSYYLRDLRQQLDAAWENFSRSCVYFPEQQQPPPSH